MRNYVKGNLLLLSTVFLLLFLMVYCQHKTEVVPVANEAVKPSLLVYQTNTILLQYKSGGDTSSVPSISGTAPINYSFSSVPNHFGNIVLQSDGSLIFKNDLDTGAYIINITATNAAGAITFASAYTVSVVITPELVTGLTYSTATLTLDQGVGGSSVVPGYSGTSPVVFDLSTSPATSGEISVSSAGVLSVSNTLAAGTYQVSVNAINAAGTANFANVYTVMVNAVLPSGLLYAPNSLSLVQGNAGTSAAPSLSTGTLPVTYSLSSIPAAPGKISINASSGVISSTTALTVGNYALTVTATNAAGNAVFTNAFSIIVAGSATAPSGLTYSPNTLSVEQGIAESSILPSISGTTPITYSLTSSPVNAAISIHATSGVITVGAGSPPGMFSISVSATNTVNTVGFPSVYSITVNAAVIPSALSYSPNSLTLSQGATGYSAMPSVSGSNPISYALSSSPANAGISINNSTGVISVSSASATGTFTISVTASNLAGNTIFSGVYSIVVNVPLISFATNIKPLIISKCSNCHTSGGQTNFTVYGNTSTDINLILDRINRTQGDQGFMPKNGTKLTQAEIDLIQNWKDQGFQP